MVLRLSELIRRIHARFGGLRVDERVGHDICYSLVRQLQLLVDCKLCQNRVIFDHSPHDVLRVIHLQQRRDLFARSPVAVARLGVGAALSLRGPVAHAELVGLARSAGVQRLRRERIEVVQEPLAVVAAGPDRPSPLGQPIALPRLSGLGLPLRLRLLHNMIDAGIIVILSLQLWQLVLPATIPLIALGGADAAERALGLRSGRERPIMDHASG